MISLGFHPKSSYINYNMSAEDIHYEAEKLGLREKLFERVKEFRHRVPSTELNEAYDIVWSTIKKEINT